MNARSPIETVLLAALFLILGWLGRGLRDAATEDNFTLEQLKAIHAEAIASTAKTAATVARIEAKAGEISKGMALNAKAIDDLSKCELDPELTRLFQLRQQTINEAIGSPRVQTGERR